MVKAPTKMTVWTVQPLVVWESLEKAGTLGVDTSYYPYLNDSEVYIPWQYQWLARQLQERVPGYTGGLPWWSYTAKPDLRWVRHRTRRAQVRIELEMTEGLTFPCWAWNEVHGGQFLAFTKREQEEWMMAMRHTVPDEDLWPLPDPWRSELEASWLRLFDPELPINGWADVDKPAPQYQEAVFETLRLENVRNVTHFIGTSRYGL